MARIAADCPGFLRIESGAPGGSAFRPRGRGVRRHRYPCPAHPDTGLRRHERGRCTAPVLRHRPQGADPRRPKRSLADEAGPGPAIRVACAQDRRRLRQPVLLPDPSDVHSRRSAASAATGRCSSRSPRCTSKASRRAKSPRCSRNSVASRSRARRSAARLRCSTTISRPGASVRSARSPTSFSTRGTRRYAATAWSSTQLSAPPSPSIVACTRPPLGLLQRSRQYAIGVAGGSGGGNEPPDEKRARREITDQMLLYHAGYHSIRVNEQWRVVFRWEGADAREVRIVDYHS